ncbi:MAG: tRNA uridine-5-carboxymethylaminomethyl(34) synthesis GTPase MnmE [Spirochaetales bacterium]|nr:tRNA uridine-5-carboxymethylaminomethyl(34) synthesis GTPase MnmE [Leptospiraceae bacterium]MCP5482253.1 tRNA uridine-5-carboxymethylaminomethyl(34) synthesis GTPase MnmE [Spirochaetales bacterium]MCP5484635.1 tRNA uridine-5-carboxymethylaminomethyl(34) synthesis GTPase MnmE [Spirochaetales bacterium]
MDAETIVAISTGAGPAAIGVVRMTGPGVADCLSRHCRTPDGRRIEFQSRAREQVLCDLIDDDTDVIDRALVTFFPGPHSYTGEDVAEFSLHGNPILLRAFVDAVLHGASGRIRPARPGEFTKRAYLNGHLDLSQAEAVHRMVTARSRFELEAGRKNLFGEISRLTSRFRSALIHLKAETEAEVDFSTEDLTFNTLAERKEQVRALVQKLDELLRRARETERISTGFQVALVGVPNAGKSSLLNRILGWERAIVSPIAGTTRDYVTEEILFDGVPVRFVDTAGIRDTADVIEEQGVRMSLELIRKSDLVLHLIDASRPPVAFPSGLERASQLVHLINKIDIDERTAYYEARYPGERFLGISCLTGAGLTEFRSLLGEYMRREDVGGEPLLLEARQKHHLENVRQALLRALELLEQNAPQEIVAIEIDGALEQTGELTGRIDSEEILGRIFSVFCVGK